MAKNDASENMVLRTVYLPKALDKRLRAIAFDQELSKGELMRVLIAEAMQHRAGLGQAAFAGEGAAKPVVAPPAAPAPKARAPKPAAEPKAQDIQQSIFDFLDA
ncbi:ribbon-helix-helix protein, CopG family [Caulobacter sp. NIBR2454]|uniref:ribbon-helix-helix protein, CopG family n=1 Tax=Caulobacter sp. NIBR2454 TaxID=3015996 RepID=UPI0022B693F4|nr:ribbon-helix-helix protein, CopG family [Caulobacter sp. NIBR2454]